MVLSTTGEPVIVQKDNQVHVGVDLRPGHFLGHSGEITRRCR